MRRRLMFSAIVPVLVGAALLAPRILSEAHAEEVPPIDCESWFEHYVSITDQIRPFADARAAGSEEQRAEAQRLFVADCEKVVADPVVHSEDMEVLRCTLGADDAAAWMTCVDPFPPKPTGGHAEAENLLSGIRTAERAYEAEWDTFTACDPTPPEIPGADRVPFVGGGEMMFRNLGWLPDGHVQCRYSVTISDNGYEFEARAECDEDGDGKISVWKTTKTERPERITPEEVR